VNTPLPVRFDADRPDRLKPLDDPSVKSQVGEMHRKPKAIRIPASLPYQGYILN
jgi:hypothetical protein